MRTLTLQEAFKIIDSRLENGSSLKNVLSTMAIENMFVSEEFLMELISVERGNKSSEQLVQETIAKYKKPNLGVNVSETMKFAMTGDDEFKELLYNPEFKKEGAKNMCTVVANLKSIGRAEGEKNMLYRLVSEGKFDIYDAAEELEMSVECFSNEMGKAGYKVPAMG